MDRGISLCCSCCCCCTPNGSDSLLSSCSASASPSASISLLGASTSSTSSSSSSEEWSPNNAERAPRREYALDSSGSRSERSKETAAEAAAEEAGGIEELLLDPVAACDRSGDVAPICDMPVSGKDGGAFGKLIMHAAPGEARAAAAEATGDAAACGLGVLPSGSKLELNGVTEGES